MHSDFSLETLSTNSSGHGGHSGVCGRRHGKLGSCHGKQATSEALEAELYFWVLTYHRCAHFHQSTDKLICLLTLRQLRILKSSV